MSFFEKLEKQCNLKNSLLCVGLDPVVEQDCEDVYEAIVEKNSFIIKSTEKYCVCYKPNIAFYEAYGESGYKALKKTIELIPDDIPILLDAKRNDIGNTAKAYAKAAFEELKVDGITLNPYMGFTSAEPFIEYEDKGFFQLCKTSNPESDKIQNLIIEKSGKELYLEVGKSVCSWSSRNGLVVAGNDIEALSKVRKELPDVWMLSPGIGAQGGTMYEAVEAGIREDGLGILPVVVRAIANSDNPDSNSSLKQNVLKGLIETECFKLGSFTLKSGLKSPFYVDLRRTSSSPKFMKEIGKAYAELLKELKCDRIAGIPVAAMPLATVASLETGIPMIYPRITKKGHGTGNLIEGDFKKGERVVLLDDLITTGKSKIEAIEILRDAGLIVEDLVVLLERGSQGRKDMEAAGVNLYAFSPVEDLFLRCKELDLIDEDKFDELNDYVKS